MLFRTLIATLLLFGYVATSVEVVVGQLRDGEVHHESVVAAADHQAKAPGGEHGHEEPVSDEEHGPDHQHGTSGDHCTHTHSVSLPAATPLLLLVHTERTERAHPRAISSGTFTVPPFHPPKV